MEEKDPRVDSYIEKAPSFARPILVKLRRLIFQACPDAVESIKWSFPNYEIYGSMLCSMAAFKEHCAFGFWKATLLKDPDGILHLAERNSMGHLDRLQSLKDLPSDKILTAYLKEASILNKNKVKVVRAPSVPKKALPVPKSLAAALNKNKKAKAAFERFSPSQKRDYIEWIIEAKTEETMNRRVETTVEWSAEGKTRNWKYERKA
jgi:uncharacterized protein YdeI (YjbR/CyaY-like superfamily)